MFERFGNALGSNPSGIRIMFLKEAKGFAVLKLWCFTSCNFTINFSDNSPKQ